MSGDCSCDINAIWKCPFCGRPTWKIQLPDQYGTLIETGEPDWSDGITKYEGGLEIKELVLRIECEATKDKGSPFDCPAMDESGSYNLHIRPNGDCHAYYY